MSAMANTGWERSALMVQIPPVEFYRCHSIHLQHKHGDYTKSAAKKCASDNEQEHWKTLKGMVQQDAFAALLQAYQDLKASHNIFKF